VIATHCARLAGSTSQDALWTAATALERSTLFGGFKIDAGSGAQVKHRTVLVRWSGGELAGAGSPGSRGAAVNGRSLDADGERTAANRLD
jgi:hypothetical protein